MKDQASASKKKKKKKTVLIILGTIFIILLAFRLYLPTIVLKYVNKKLNNIPDYVGHVDDITISLWRGAYQIQGIKLNKLSGKVPVPFFSAKTIDLSVEWRALFHGSIVAKILFAVPVINFVSGPTEATSQTGIDTTWRQTLRELVPIKINRLEIRNGEIHFRDFYSTPKVDIFLSNIKGLATNLTNSDKNKEILPAKVEAEATCFQTGSLHLEMAVNPFSKQPTFELKEALNNVELTSLNDFLNAYSGLEVKSGKFRLYTEVASYNGDFIGYTKPFFVDLKVNKSLEENKTLFREIWANIVSFMGWVLTNPKEDQVATKIPIHGHFSKVTVDIWPAIGNLLKNAFIEALLPSLDNDVNISDIKHQGTLKRH
jgi:hypothetical protein